MCLARGARMLMIACMPLLATAVPATGRATQLMDLWAPLPATPPFARSGASFVHDTRRDRLVMFGGNTIVGPRNDVWAYQLGTRTWAPIVIQGVSPSERYRHSAIYDPVADRMIVFGGATDAGNTADVWVLNLATRTWSQPITSGAIPSPRARHSVIFDTKRYRMVLFGGSVGGGQTNDVYTLDLNTFLWTKINPSGPPPEPREAAAAIYRNIRDQMIIFGGLGQVHGALNDAWLFDLQNTHWTNVTPSAGKPPARLDHSATYDSLLDRMIVYGGSDGTVSLNDQYWMDMSFAPFTWTQVYPTHGPPSPRGAYMSPSALIDRRWHIFGGANMAGDFFNDSWALNVDSLNWEVQPDSGHVPPKRMAAQAVNDPQRNRMVVFGGWTGRKDSAMNDTWVLNYGPLGVPALTWDSLATTGPVAGRYGSGHLYDPDSIRMLCFYGGTNDDAFADDITQLDLATARWSILPTLNPGPSSRTGSAVVYDSLRHRIVLFGGMRQGVGNEMGNVSLNDTWILDMATRYWTQVANEEGALRPASRLRMAHCSDDARDRMLISCGADTVAASRDTSYFYNDTWAFDYSTLTWSQLPTTNDPSERFDILSFIIPDQDRMIIFGGATKDQFNDSDETYSLDLQTMEWTLVNMQGQAPEKRNGYTFVYDYARRWMIPYSGIDPGSGTGDSPILGNGGIFYQAPKIIDYDTAARGTPQPPSSTPVTRLRADVRAVRGGSVDIAVWSPAAGRADLALYRADGRCVWRTALTTDGTQDARLRWNGRSSSGTPVPSGVYVLHVTAGGDRVAQKIAFVR